MPRSVVVLAFPGVQLLDVAGATEVFAVASDLLPDGCGYRVLVAAPQAGPVRTRSGVDVVAATGLADLVPGEIDTLLVAGALRASRGGARAVVDPQVVAWLAEHADAARRVASMCAGAHSLAGAGLLDGRRATTHWLTAGQLATEHPAVTVDQDPIFVRSGTVWTGAGATAGLDLALALVGDDHGPEVALATARALVMYVQRPGGQSQFSVPLSVQDPTDERIAGLLRWIGDHLDQELCVPDLAARLHLSVRHFSRLFRQRTGRTPAAYLEQARLEAARRLLEQTDATLPQVAAASGYGSVESLHRQFQRRLSTTPARYRRRFRVPDAAAG